jgi:membrane protease YdiL (CAAX protease family)
VAIGIALFFAVQAVAAVVVAAVALAVSGTADNADGGGLWLLALAAPLTWVVLIGWPWFVSKSKGTGSMARDFGLAVRGTDILVGIGGGILALVGSVVLALSYGALFGEDAPSNTDFIANETVGPLLLVMLLAVVAVGTPVAEEIFFRGLVLGAARKSWGTALGVVFSSALFGLFHVQAELASWAFVAVVTGVYGAVFALTRVWTQGRLAAPIVAHMMVNAVAVVAVVAAG